MTRREKQIEKLDSLLWHLKRVKSNLKKWDRLASSSPAFCQFGHDKDCEGVVDFLESSFVVTDRKTFARPLFTEDDHVEIIGNIYDNPELLEK